MADERPNIRIEIQNNIMESMDVDDKLSDGEEGEIVEEANDFDDYIDHNIKYPTRPTIEQHKKKWPIKDSNIFALGINIFDKEEQSKLSERAKRFALDPNEVTNFTDKDLKLLYDSLGITDEFDKEVRFEAIHMHGTDDLSSEEILSYFASYAPAYIEWVNDECCNIVWTDRIGAARALFFLSRAVKGMPVTGPCDPFAFKREPEESGRSILLKNNNREVELDDKSMDDSNEVSIKDIEIPIPPGYWRIGVKHHKSKAILLRFALKSDKKPAQAEKFSDYYKRHGNPNYGGLKGIISESRKAQMKGIFDRNRDINTKNPWGDLAKTWNRDRKEEVVRSLEELPQPNSIMKQRLGFKRAQTYDEEPEEKSKVPRMRMYADEEEEKIRRKRELDAVRRLANPPKEEQKDLRKLIRSRDNSESAIEGQNDLGSKLINRRLKFPSSTQDLNEKLSQKRNELLKRLDTQSKTKQHRFREQLLKSKRPESPAPIYSNSSRDNGAKYTTNSDYEEDEVYSDDDDMKTNSKVTVVIKKQKKPAVASTVWSRVNMSNTLKQSSVKDRLNTEGIDREVGKMRSRRNRDSESSSSENNSIESVNNSSSEGENDQDENMLNSAVVRPGFRNDLDKDSKPGDHKSPLRIEINNDHYQK